MKKLFSALIILATVLALALSLISCSPDKEEAAAKKVAVAELYSQEELSPSFTEEEIKDFIYGWTGNYASWATTDGFAPDNTVGLFRLDNDWYAAYIVTGESYYSPKTEAIIRFQPYSFDYETYCMIGDANTDEFSSAAIEAISYANNLELGSYGIENLAIEIVLKNFGYASNVLTRKTYEGSVEYIFYESTHGVHVAYIDTKVLDQTYCSYIKALVLYQGASNIIDIQPIAFDFTTYNSYDIQPSYDDVIAFLDQFRGYYGLEDTARYESIYGYEEACEYFFDAMEQAHKCVQEFAPTEFEAWVSETFGPGSSPVLVVVGLVVSIIMSLIVLTVIFLPVALVPILLAIILMLFIIILILVISKIKLKKRVKKLALEVASKKAESAEATDEGAATEGAEGENA